MAKLNRIRVVLAERDLNNKWLADRLGKDQATVSKWVTLYIFVKICVKAAKNLRCHQKCPCKCP